MYSRALNTLCNKARVGKWMPEVPLQQNTAVVTFGLSKERCCIPNNCVKNSFCITFARFFPLQYSVFNHRISKYCLQWTFTYTEWKVTTGLVKVNTTILPFLAKWVQSGMIKEAYLCENCNMIGLSLYQSFLHLNHCIHINFGKIINIACLFYHPKICSPV